MWFLFFVFLRLFLFVFSMASIFHVFCISLLMSSFVFLVLSFFFVLRSFVDLPCSFFKSFRKCCTNRTGTDTYTSRLRVCTACSPICLRSRMRVPGKEGFCSILPSSAVVPSASYGARLASFSFLRVGRVCRFHRLSHRLCSIVMVHSC